MFATSMPSTFVLISIVIVSLMSCMLFLLSRRVKFLGRDEQVVIEDLTETRTINGPKTAWLPLFYKAAYVRKAVSIGPLEYIYVTSSLTGTRRVEVGPAQLFLGPYDEEDGGKQQAVSLKATQYVRLVDKQTGAIRVEVGEQGRVVPGPYESFLDGGVREATTLGPLEYCFVRNMLTNTRRVEVGPKLLQPGPFDEEDGGKQQALSLKATQFVRFVDKNTGAIRVEVGEQGRVFPGPYESFLDNGGVRDAIALKNYEYVKVEDKRTGAVRVVKGEKLVFLTGHEEVVGRVCKGVEVDDETAALVRNKRTGQQRLVTEKQVFIPGPDEEVMEERKLVKLADYEACIVRGKDGGDQFYFGNVDAQRSFFLPPHSELVQLCWSRGRRRERRDLYLKTIDLRPCFMSFEFNTRTVDNVELTLEGTFFWEVIDLKAMHKMTADTTGDICNHARSKFIERVSKVTLKEFMGDFNKIAELVHKEDDGFYSQRGVLIHTLEVSGYRCCEGSTAQILEQIIQETTNRMNRLQQQESENEVQLFQIKGEIEREHANKELLDVQVENSNAKATMEGLAESQKVKSFLAGLKDEVPELDKRVAMWNTLRKKDALAEVCKGGSRMYYTPKDVNLSIEDRSGGGDGYGGE